ncbi:MAG: hypothetical protein ACTTKN_01040 [Phocaeicola sp.]|uniref:hypothetical protein n=1 Tax=Phocaeicola TaxID=909656 RepID=UPI00234F56A4|nr:hypothetical protein [Phocaeicola oris]MCE2616884.1 hypothetical protein [Phocaeicola oris]
MENKYTEQPIRQFRDHDIGLRKALEHGMENDTAKYPTNLPYFTLQRIKEERNAAAKRAGRWDAVLAGLVVIIGLIAIVVFCGPALVSMIKDMRQDILSEGSKSFNGVFFILTGICFCFLFGLNEFLRRHFYK